MGRAKDAGAPFISLGKPDQTDPDLKISEGAAGEAVEAPAAAQGTLSSSQATDLFNDMAAQEDIAFGYPQDGCYARAHLMTQRIQERGTTPGKVWSFSNPDHLYVETTNSPSGFVEWGYHVAPTVPVQQPDGSVQSMVIDPSMFDGPVSIKEWSSAQRRLGSSEPYVTETVLGEAPTAPTVWRGEPGGQLEGSGYWPGPDPSIGVDEHAEETMEEYLRYERNNGS